MKKIYFETPLIVFYNEDFPNLATHCHQESCGFSVYKNVLVQWDEDTDTRVLKFIDELPEKIREQLVLVQEHEGSIALRWRDYVPEDYKENVDGVEVEVDGDNWSIFSSYTVKQEFKEKET